MVKIDDDTIKLRTSGETIIKLANEYEETIEDFFRRIQNIPTTTKEWLGISAEKFVSISLLEKPNYIEYGKSLKELGQTLIYYANEVDETATNEKVS